MFIDLFYQLKNTIHFDKGEYWELRHKNIVMGRFGEGYTKSYKLVAY